MVQKLFSNNLDEMKRLLSGFVIVSMMSLTLLSCIDKEKRNSADDSKKVKNTTTSQNENTYEPGQDWKLAWSDEFEINGAPDPTNWTYDLGDGGWGNGEAQTYTNDSENVIVEDGFLKITAKTDGAGGYTSARIKSENLQEFTYGRVEVRAKLPSVGGTWPAIWTLGANFDIVGWPACGEMDIMEHVGNNPNTVLSTLHYTSNSGGAGPTGSIEIATATSDFHNYTMEWTADTVEFWVDDNPVHNTFVNNTNTPFNNDFFFIMNVAMGGSLGGTIDPAFTEDTMEIDYIRVYQ
jgi:beta-glucanase (GH16 family)